MPQSDADTPASCEQNYRAMIVPQVLYGCSCVRISWPAAQPVEAAPWLTPSRRYRNEPGQTFTERFEPQLELRNIYDGLKELSFWCNL